jgi:hypothetical protein
MDVFAGVLSPNARMALGRLHDRRVRASGLGLLGVVGVALAAGALLAPRAPGVAGMGLRASATPATFHRQGLASVPRTAEAPVFAALAAESDAYRVSGVAGGFRATNGGQRLDFRFGRDGVLVRSRELRLTLGLAGAGYGASLAADRLVAPTASANRVSYAHPGLIEWYKNGPLGLEQGFTVPHPLSTQAGAPLTLGLKLSGNARASLATDRRSLSLIGPRGTSLRYSGLSATDADGHNLRSWMELRDGVLLLRVDTRAARYPVQIDPFIQQAELTGSGESGSAAFGFSVALSSNGKTALIGGYEDNGKVGAAWVFKRSGSSWAQQGGKLTGSGEVGKAAFGAFVTLSADGNTALIGGPEDNAGVGAAWVFTRAGSSWVQQGAKLTGSGESGAGGFGDSVALSREGSTALIGGPSDNGSVGGAWVFTRTGSSWSQQGGKLTGGGESGEGLFGYSAGLSSNGNTALVAGPADNGTVGAAWVFTRAGSSWSQQGGKLTGGGESGEGAFGASAALAASGKTALIGGPGDGGFVGAAWAFKHAHSGWVQQGGKLTGSGESGEGSFGYSVALSRSGNTALIGGPADGANVGAAWEFKRAGSSWTQQGEKLTGGGESGAASFGTSVALSGMGTAGLVGGPEDTSNAGAAWVFTGG